MSTETPEPKIDMLADIRRAYEQVKEQRRIIICRPDNEQAVRLAVRALPWAGLFKVRISTLVPPGQIYVAKPDSLLGDPWDDDEGIDVDQVEMEELGRQGWLARLLGRLFGHKKEKQ